jgi:hypothetical protein
VTTATVAVPGGYAPAVVPCAVDAACHAPATHVHLTMYGNGDQAILTCEQHQSTGRKILGRTTSAIIFTLRLADQEETP